MNIDWEKIKKEYIRGYNTFKRSKYFKTKIEFDDIKEFFKYKNIFICVGYLWSNRENKNVWLYHISYKNKLKDFGVYNPVGKYLSEEESEIESVYKAFEILEEK